MKIVIQIKKAEEFLANQESITTTTTTTTTPLSYQTHPQTIYTMIMKCWDARVTHRPTFKELFNELRKYYWDSYYYLKEGKNNDSNIRNYIEVF
ncbi:hypothetical protein Glove_86g9 [Diversispora epigaea]|uniref:Serine-threonine/tyrosine-protein kinase catalytic domain-containing protein n=1 Tax=Diversispora epigaea TaxID=1348612 RepID=A0A397JB31_9GLOM|nr:hypothetical protein Glove_86g9 [Diversispora epigaea]